MNSPATKPPMATGEMGIIRPIYLLRQVYPISEARVVTMGTGELVIGRAPNDTNGLTIADGEASRRHASIVFDRRSNSHTVTDLGSSNGTFVNGQRISSEKLEDGSVVRTGRSIFVYVRSALGPGVTLPNLTPRLSLARALVEGIADRAATSGLPVLIYGPTGAGKERMAERLHVMSQRAGRLVSLNCGALSSELLGSELFGHVKGAFSGAQAARTGLFAAATGGSLFLDEIAELPLEQQPALLRACETGRIRPVGADRDQSVDVRIIAATHTDLDLMCAAGTFRTDLLARLRGVTLQLPSLSKRRDEILALFDEFVDGIPFGITVAERLLLYRWKENVRELKNVAEYVRLFAQQAGSVHPSHLPSHVVGGGEPVSSGPPGRSDLEDLLRIHGGNMSKVARELGVHRQQAYRWITKEGLNPAKYRRS
ncbi:MAG: sigma 54-interacting transcriptional regulator [Bradymonadia bacterium]